jgi:hypothetical protein
MQENEQLNSEKQQLPKLTTVPVDPTVLEEEIVMEAVEDAVETTEDDLNKKNYIKISPTFYIRSIDSDKVDEDGEKIELFQILNPENNVIEKRELSTEEKHEILVQQHKESKIKFHPLKHGTVKTIRITTVVNQIGRKHKVKIKDVQTNLTTNQFGAEYRKKRQRKNKMAKASRKANR